MSFKELGLRAELLRAAGELGFENPMPIQEKSIPVLLAGDRDFVGLAQTGTGKTGAFGLPLIQQMDDSRTSPQGIVICPTRELCLQITSDLKQFARHMKNVEIAAVYGGASISNQIREIRKGARIIVATPGRLIDLTERRALSLSDISYAVLDEADEMLNMGFQEDIDRILAQMPEKRRIWLFSATMPEGVAAIARNYLSDPVEVSMGHKNRGAENIIHNCYVMHEKNRYDCLKRILDFTPDIFGLVFCRTRKETQDTAEALMKDGYQAEALHGDLSQTQRDYVMRKFRQGTVRILVATDVAARGIDVDDITHVIHYKLPDEAEIYTHRSGRTARAGKSGYSVVLINSKEMRRVRELERRGKFRFEFCKIPGGREICGKQLCSMADRIVRTEVNEGEMESHLTEVYDVLDQFDKEELIRRFVSAEFDRLFDYYRHAGDINIHVRPGKAPESGYTENKSERRRLRGKKTERFFINVGRLDKINEGAIIRLICSNSGIRSGKIGKIDLNREFSFFEVEKSAAGIVQKTVNRAKLDGRTVEIRQIAEKRNASKGAAHRSSRKRT
ncbi:MAG: DEAD/DEAH box helicase [Desulfococcaceae bacterium]|jgi:ATP-dependent RNA helicase DeaD|nr:DEAD/DEAH box helicase [Desulfococcaceae bacterium]